MEATDESENTPPLGERRSHRRARVLWQGGYSSSDRDVDCVVLEISAGGAKVHVSDPFSCSDTGTLRFPRFGDFRTEVIWRKTNVMGLRFLEPPKSVAKAILAACPHLSLAP